jgi:CelD/BcsL family acetyltransferase involved in cellulose biosynthesis
MTLHIRSIDNARDFVSLEPIWSRLTHETGQSSPFLSYDWFWCCWHGVWPQRRPEILVIEDGDTPVAIIPLMRWRARLYGLPVNNMSFLEGPHSPITDLVTTNQSDPVIELFLDHLTSRSDWDIVRLQKLPITSPILQAFEHILPGRISWRREDHLAYPYVTIDGDWERFWGTMSKSFGNTYQHIPIALQRAGDLRLEEHALQQPLALVPSNLQRAGDLRLEEHRLVDPQSALFQETLALMDLQTCGSHVSTTMPRQREFFRALTQRATKNGWLSLWTLKLDGHIIAFEYQLRFHSTVQVLATGEDPSYNALRPWAELNLAILRTLFQSGSSYEYCLGPAAQHDYLWQANGNQQTVRLKLYRPSLYSRVLAQLDGGAVSETGNVRSLIPIIDRRG